MDVEELARALWDRFGREVSATFSLDEPPGTEYAWMVMVEGDRGGYAGSSLAEALESRLEGPEPEGSTGWGADAQ
jgi:hypothetical protein